MLRGVTERVLGEGKIWYIIPEYEGKKSQFRLYFVLIKIIEF